MSPNQYVSDLRAEVAVLRAVVARVEELADRWEAAGLVPMGHYATRAVRDALSGDVSSRSARVSTDSDPAATERQGEAEGAGDGV